jgi:hypothetical protein
VSTTPEIREPDEMLTIQGDQVAHWGQVGVVKMGEPCDPIPSVYADDRPGREIEFDERPMSLDEAEQFAARILNAVRWQRARNAEKRAAELNAMATGAAATHDWHQPRLSAECRHCRTVIHGGDELLVAGVVPTCGTQCSMSWHEIDRSLPGDAGDAVCIFCKASWSAEHLYVLQNRHGRSLPVGPFLTFDQAATIVQPGLEFVPFKLRRDEALAAMAEHKRSEEVTRDV